MVGFRTAKSLDRVLEVLSANGDKDMILSRYHREPLLGLASQVLHLAADFDNTLTPDNEWVLIQRYLLEDLRAQEQADRDWYLAQTSDSVQSVVSLEDPDWFQSHVQPGNRVAVEGAWIARSLARHMQSGLNRGAVVTVGKEMKPRAGLPELFQLTQHQVVISFGIEQVVLSFLANQGLQAAVAANRLCFEDGDGLSGNMSASLTGYGRNVVVSSTKAIAARLFAKQTGGQPPNILSIGDSIVDLDMMPDNGFNVLLLPPGEANRKLAAFRDNHLAAMWGKLTIILVSDSLMPLVDLIRESRAL